MKKHPILRNILIDAVCAGLALVIFALFHHVLPRQQQGLQITVPITAGANETTAAPTERPADRPPQRSTERPTDRPTERPTERPTARPTNTPTAVPAATEAPSASRSQQTYGSNGGSGGWSSSQDDAQEAGQDDSQDQEQNDDWYSSNGNGWNSSRNNGRNSNQNSARTSGWNGGKGGSALSDGEETPDTADTTPISQKFADKYTDTVVITANSYSSPDISITVTEETLDNGRITYYLADIYVRDITCFQTAFAKDTFGTGYREEISDMAALHSALLAVNGDYYGNTNEGVVIRNGVIYRANNTSCDVCVLYYDGTMRVMPGSAFSMDEAIADGAWQAWTFGPALLDTDGSVLSSFSSTSHIISANPRTAIGYFEPGHYCLVVVDGRGDSKGITLSQLSQLFYDLGCAAAYNLDGGDSSVMVWQDAVINDPSGGGRESSDALLIAEVRSYD